MKCFLVTAIIVFAMTLNPAYGSDDISEIQDKIQKYFEGTSQGKPELLKEVFLPSLEIQWIDSEGNFRRRAGPEYISNVKAGQKVPRYGHIVNIDVTNNIAATKVEIIWNERQYTDYILLIKISNEWKIANKIATWEKR